MQHIFSKTSFPKAPGGDRYEWKEVETTFQIGTNGLFVIKIVASARNAQQNRRGDDDDLRMALDAFDFGKYERHQGMISWKGFGVSASWDGASLKGGTKTIYFFAPLQHGSHTIQFFADETPILKSLEVFEIKNNVFELANLKPPEKIENDRRGIPWLSFVFMGTHTKTFTLAVHAQSAKTKHATDGDNLKVVVNGKIIQNPHAPKSYTYKNFYFSGDVKEFDILTVTHEDFEQPLAFEGAVEFWYDEEPEISSLKIEYFDNAAFLEGLKGLVDFKKYILGRAHAALYYFRKSNKPYSATFLEHALHQNPAPLIFKHSDPIAKKIKTDPIYEKILKKLEEKISKGNLNGEIWPEDFKNDTEMHGEINFNSDDLKTAIHGIRKIEYAARRKRNNEFELELVFFDIYDFDRQKVPFLLTHVNDYLKNTTINRLDMGEDLGLVHNFEIEIRLKETLNVNH